MVKKIIVKKAKYIPVRMPREAYLNFLKRQERIENVARKLTMKKVNIPLTKVFIISSQTPINLTDDYVKKVVKKRK